MKDQSVTMMMFLYYRPFLLLFSILFYFIIIISQNVMCGRVVGADIFRWAVSIGRSPSWVVSSYFDIHYNYM